MDLKEILAISGKPGLYKHVSKTKNGIIVESIIDQKRIPAYASAKISALEDIAIYTDEEDLPLLDILKKIFEKEEGKETINPKTSKSDELKKYFEEVIPSYDKDRVYVSDIKKVLNWYNLLNAQGLVDLEDTEDDKKEEPSTKEKKAHIEEAEVVSEANSKDKE